MWLLFHPWWLCFDWSMGCVPLVSRLSDPRLLAAVIFWACLVCLLGWTICRLHRPKGRYDSAISSTCCTISHFSNSHRLVALSISLLVLPFLPASNLFFRVGFVLAERVLYLPSSGYCLLIALGVTTLASQSTLMNRVGPQATLFCLIGKTYWSNLLQVVVIFLLYLTTMFVWKSVHVSFNLVHVGMNVYKCFNILPCVLSSEKLSMAHWRITLQIRSTSVPPQCQGMHDSLPAHTLLNRRLSQL